MDENKSLKPVVPNQEGFELEQTKEQPEQNTAEKDQQRMSMDDINVRPFGYNKPKRYVSRRVVRSPKDVPVCIEETMIDQTNNLVDLDSQFFNGHGEPVELMYDSDNRMIIQEQLYTASRLRVYPITKLFIYLPEDVRGAQNEPYTSKTNDENFVLYDQQERPIYPLGTENGGYITDRNRMPVYPALEPGNEFHVVNPQTNEKSEVKPATIQLYTKDRRPVFPYSYEDNRALDKEEEVAPIPFGYQDGYMQGGDPYNQMQNRNIGQPQPDQMQNMNYADQQNEPYNNPYSKSEPAFNKNNEPELEDDEEEPEDNEPVVEWYKQPKWITFIIVGILVLILGIWGGFKIFGGEKEKFELDSQEVTMEYEKEMRLDLKDFFGDHMPSDRYDEIEVIPDAKLNYNKKTRKLTTKGKEVLVPGDYTLQFKYKKETLNGTLIVEDTVAPVIDGNDIVSFGLGKYSNSNLLAKYDITDESEVKVSIEDFGNNFKKEGTYEVEITAVDSSKNKTSKSVKVKISKTAEQIEKEAEEKKKKEEEEKRKAEEEAKRKAEEEEAKRKAEEEAKRKEEEEKKKACEPVLPTGFYKSEVEAYSQLLQMKAGMIEAPNKDGKSDDAELVIKEYPSNCEGKTMFTIEWEN